MFDLVARQAPRGRRSLALLLSLLFNGSAFGVLAWLGSGLGEVVEEVAPRLIPAAVEYHLVSLPKVDEGGRPPKPRPKEAKTNPLEPRVTEDRTMVLAPLDPGEPDEGEDSGGGDLDNGGDNGGDDGGENGGENGGDNGGENGGDNGSTDLYRTVHWTDVRPTHRELPVFPEEARALGFTGGSCVLRIQIDGEGVPERVTPTTCPQVFVSSATRAAYGWRFTPLPEGQRAQFELRIEYSLR